MEEARRFVAMFFDPAHYLEADPATAESQEEAERLVREAEQRAGLCEAMVRVAATRGFEAATVDEVVRVSGFGKSTYYKLYRTTDACLLDAFEACAGPILAGVIEAATKAADRRAKIESGLQALLGLFAAEPEVARVLLIEIRVGGTTCREAQQRLLANFADLLEGSCEAGQAGRGTGRLAVGAIAGLLAQRVSEGRSAELPGMLGELARVGTGRYPK